MSHDEYSIRLRMKICVYPIINVSGIWFGTVSGQFRCELVYITIVYTERLLVKNHIYLLFLSLDNCFAQFRLSSDGVSYMSDVGYSRGGESWSCISV